MKASIQYTYAIRGFNRQPLILKTKYFRMMITLLLFLLYCIVRIFVDFLFITMMLIWVQNVIDVFKQSTNGDSVNEWIFYICYSTLVVIISSELNVWYRSSTIYCWCHWIWQSLSSFRVECDDVKIGFDKSFWQWQWQVALALHV